MTAATQIGTDVPDASLEITATPAGATTAFCASAVAAAVAAAAATVATVATVAERREAPHYNHRVAPDGERVGRGRLRITHVGAKTPMVPRGVRSAVTFQSLVAVEIAASMRAPRVTSWLTGLLVDRPT